MKKNHAITFIKAFCFKTVFTQEDSSNYDIKQNLKKTMSM